MQNNIKLTLAYDGLNYFGWQRTSSGPSIQETVERALSLILREDIRVNGASRTDRGVHAKGQVLNFLTHHPFSNKTLWNLNKVLPKDMSAISYERATLDFHAT
ncbi:MAG: tRNA pseudouridine(38-40) synthase TruA, partial [Parachlamydiaceae bacterium]